MIVVIYTFRLILSSCSTLKAAEALLALAGSCRIGAQAFVRK
jgi:hypothetical protein